MRSGRRTELCSQDCLAALAEGFLSEHWAGHLRHEIRRASQHRMASAQLIDVIGPVRILLVDDNQGVD